MMLIKKITKLTLIILTIYCLSFLAFAKIEPLQSRALTTNYNVDYFSITSQNVRELEILRQERDLYKNEYERRSRIQTGVLMGLGSSAGLYGEVFIAYWL